MISLRKRNLPADPIFDLYVRCVFGVVNRLKWEKIEGQKVKIADERAAGVAIEAMELLISAKR